MKWTKAELEGLWALENPGNGNPHLMAAIALAESAGDDQNVNSIGACGLWQIHPYEAGCQNPYTNARQAGRKLRSQGLGAWESYTNGSYRQFTGGSQMTGVSSTGTRKNVSSLDELLNPLNVEPFEHGAEDLQKTGEGVSGAFSFLNKLGQLIFNKEGWIRIGKVVLGLFLLIVGLLGMANVNAGEKLVGAGHKALDVAEIPAE